MECLKSNALCTLPSKIECFLNIYVSNLTHEVRYQQPYILVIRGTVHFVFIHHAWSMQCPCVPPPHESFRVRVNGVMTSISPHHETMNISPEVR